MYDSWDYDRAHVQPIPAPHSDWARISLKLIFYVVPLQSRNWWEEIGNMQNLDQLQENYWWGSTMSYYFKHSIAFSNISWFIVWIIASLACVYLLSLSIPFHVVNPNNKFRFLINLNPTCKRIPPRFIEYSQDCFQFFNLFIIYKLIFFIFNICSMMQNQCF